MRGFRFPSRPFRHRFRENVTQGSESQCDDVVVALKSSRMSVCFPHRQASGLCRMGSTGRRAALAVAALLLLGLAGLDLVKGDCWTPGMIYRNLCDESVNNKHPSLNASQYRRRLLWHGGGPEARDIPDHDLGDNKRFRGDGGTLHDSDIGGAAAGEPGTDDDTLVFSGVLEDSFFSFVEERAVEGNTDVYGREDSWYRDLFKCDPTDPTKQLCEKCGKHCNSWDWETSGYSVLNSTEFEIENLYWMSQNVYITETVLLPLSVCVQYDWWVCYRRLDENIRVSVAQGTV